MKHFVGSVLLPVIPLCCRLAIKVALAQICGKDVADHVEIKKTEDGCVGPFPVAHVAGVTAALSTCCARLISQHHLADVCRSSIGAACLAACAD